MRAILRSGFGGPEVLEIPEPEPKVGHAVIEVKAFGINHAEMHMRKGEWAEIADVSGIECVGLIKSCLGGEFAIGTKVAALMGGLGRTINGSYAEFTCAPVSNVAVIESDLSWADLAAIPETYATAWTCLFRNLEIASGQTLVIRGATSSFGQAAVNMAVNAGARVIATTRNRERFGLLEGLGVERVEVEGPELSEADRRDQAARRGARSGGEQHDPGLSRHAPPRWAGLSGRVAGRPRADRRLQPTPADGERCLPYVLWQLRVRDAGVPVVGRSAAGDRGRRGRRPVQGETVSGVSVRRYPRGSPGNGREPSPREDGRGRLSHPLRRDPREPRGQMRFGAGSRTPSALGVPSGPAIGGRKGVGSRI